MIILENKDFVLGVLAGSNGAEHTPVQVQKLFFIIDREISKSIGGPYFNFTAYDYGPFDSKVYDELKKLEQDGDVETSHYSSGLRRYKFTIQGQEKGTTVLKSWGKKVSDYIIALSNWVRSLSFAELVSAIYKAYPEMKVNSVFRGTE